MKTLALCIIFLPISAAVTAQNTAMPDTILIKNLQQANEISQQQIQQLGNEVQDLKAALQKQQKAGFDKFSTCSVFLDAAMSNTNNLQSLISKESYRNKIVALNNPTSNELGFNLEMEIQNALKPLIAKTSKTNTSKLGQVVNSVMQIGQTSLGLFPAGNVFTSLVSIVGNSTVQEKKLKKKTLTILSIA
jgi:hypothetical protein